MFACMQPHITRIMTLVINLTLYERIKHIIFINIYFTRKIDWPPEIQNELTESDLEMLEKKQLKSIPNGTTNGNGNGYPGFKICVDSKYDNPAYKDCKAKCDANSQGTLHFRLTRPAGPSEPRRILI